MIIREERRTCTAKPAHRMSDFEYGLDDVDDPNNADNCIDSDDNNDDGDGDERRRNAAILNANNRDDSLSLLARLTDDHQLSSSSLSRQQHSQQPQRSSAMSSLFDAVFTPATAAAAAAADELPTSNNSEQRSAASPSGATSSSSSSAAVSQSIALISSSSSTSLSKLRPSPSSQTQHSQSQPQLMQSASMSKLDVDEVSGLKVVKRLLAPQLVRRLADEYEFVTAARLPTHHKVISSSSRRRESRVFSQTFRTRVCLRVARENVSRSRRVYDRCSLAKSAAKDVERQNGFKGSLTFVFLGWQKLRANYGNFLFTTLVCRVEVHRSLECVDREAADAVSVRLGVRFVVEGARGLDHVHSAPGAARR